MTDLTTQVHRWCEENVRYTQKFRGNSGNIYVVTCNEMNPGDYAINWHCTCKGWQYHGKCRHQSIALSRRCHYGNGAAIGSPTKMGDICPQCTGPTVPVEVAS